MLHCFSNHRTFGGFWFQPVWLLWLTESSAVSTGPTWDEPHVSISSDLFVCLCILYLSISSVKLHVNSCWVGVLPRRLQCWGCAFSFSLEPWPRPLLSQLSCCPSSSGWLRDTQKLICPTGWGAINKPRTSKWFEIAFCVLLFEVYLLTKIPISDNKSGRVVPPPWPEKSHLIGSWVTPGVCLSRTCQIRPSTAASPVWQSSWVAQICSQWDILDILSSLCAVGPSILT